MIRKIQWDSKILGKLKLDFVNKKTGNPYKTIVFAGDNGTGKTTILNDLATFLNSGTFEPFSEIEYEADGGICQIFPTDNPKGDSPNGFHKRLFVTTGEESVLYTNRNNNRALFESDKKDIRYYGFAYSRARTGFKTDQITKTTATSIDRNKYNDDPDNRVDYTSLKQLIVDVDSEDCSSIASAFRQGTLPLNPDLFETQLKLFRFKNAFNTFFDGTLSFYEVQNNDKAEKEVYFKKHGKTIPLDKLSTGEKQIVFRGTQLLSNSQAMKGGIVLVDEPELSMHPKWQEKVLAYYQNLFKEGGKQTSQLFIATHSEFVIQSALEDPDALVVVLKDNNGVVVSRNVVRPFVLSKITNAEIVYHAFGIYTNDYHNQLYVCLQSKTGTEESVKACDDYIKSASGFYIPSKHQKPSVHTSSRGTTNYETLPTYIRNAIDHYNSGNSFTKEELITSTELLKALCERIP